MADSQKKTSLPDSDQLVEELHTEINSFRSMVNMGDIENMSKKELKRYSTSLRKLLIEMVEYPVERTQKLTDAEAKIASKAGSIKQKYAVLSMLVVSDNTKGENNE